MRRQINSTSLFSVQRRTYPDPTGGEIARDVVVHPGAVVLLPVLGDGGIVMIRNYRYTVERELLELPAGTMEEGEPPIETARRELQEETGYQAGRIEPFTEFYTSPGILTERMRAFVATDLTPGEQRLQDGERIVVEVVDASRAKCMLIDGEFEDGKTMAVLGMFFARDGR